VQKLPKQKEKAMAGKIYFPKPLIAFCRDYSRFKKENGISTRSGATKCLSNAAPKGASNARQWDKKSNSIFYDRKK